jgi:hypothetical protein
MSIANAFGGPASGWTQSRRMAEAADGGRTCSVGLIDRRTGAAHRINGAPLVVFTRRPDEAAADLMDGRDPAVWEVRIEPLSPAMRS